MISETQIRSGVRGSDLNLPVVAVGASAGGLEAFIELLRHLPTNTGMAFVLIQHLSPDYESNLSGILSKATTMPVTEVADGTLLRPDHVYVIPPNTKMTLAGAALELKPREMRAKAVDEFLVSLAETRKNASIAVILSGTGSDGTDGVQAVAEEGGIVFAQEPSSAQFDGMPRAAIASGCVDFVLPLPEIAAELGRLTIKPALIRP